MTALNSVVLVFLVLIYQVHLCLCVEKKDHIKKIARPGLEKWEFLIRGHQKNKMNKGLMPFSANLFLLNVKQDV